MAGKKSPLNDSSHGSEESKKDASDDTRPEAEWDTDSDRDSKGKIGETVKKVMTLGLSAAFLTEESIRHMVSEFKLPKEVLGSVLQTASKSKTEFLDRVSNEVIKMINKIDLVKEASRFVETHKFRISAEIDVIRKDTGETSMRIHKEGESKIEIK